MGTRKDGIRRQRDKLRCSRRGVGIGIRPLRIDQHASAVGPPELLECCSERCEASVPLRIALGESHQRADAPHPIRPLRARRERPRGYTAADKCDEFPPPHGAYPKAKDHGSSIAGLGVASVACIATKSEKRRFGLPLRPSRSRKATFCDLNHRCRRDAGLFSLARKAMLDRDGPDAFPLLALARIRSSRSCGAVNRRRVYSVACVGHLNRRLEWQTHDFSPGKLQTMSTTHARGGEDYSHRLRTESCCLCLYSLRGDR